jgi:hypothetical protein
MSFRFCQHIKMKGVLTTLDEHRLGTFDHWVIYFMGSIMVIDQKAYWYDRGSARRALSVMLSKEYNSNPTLKKRFKNIGEYRVHLEKAKLVSVCKSRELDVSIKIDK